MTRNILLKIKKFVDGDGIIAEDFITKREFEDKTLGALIWLIAEKDTIISEKDKIIDSERGKVVNLLSINDTHKAIEENLNQNVADLKKDLKKANRVRIKPIIISAVLGSIAGAYLGK